MVLGKLPVPGRPAYLDLSRARAYYACSRCGWGLFGHFFSHLSFLFSFSLSTTLAVGAGGGCLDIFTLDYPFSLLSFLSSFSLSLGDGPI